MKRIFKRNRTEIIKIFVSVLLIVFAALIYQKAHVLSLILYIAAYVLSAYKIAFDCFKEIIKDKKISDKLLVLAVSAVSMVTKYFADGCVLVVLYCFVSVFSAEARGIALRYKEKLSAAHADYARIRNGETVDISLVRPDDIIEVREGEKIALDGDVTEGVGRVDTSVLTFRNTTQEVRPGSEVLSGYTNIGSTLYIKVKRGYKQSVIHRMSEIADNAADGKTSADAFITKFSKIYIALAFAASLIVAFLLPLFNGNEFVPWIYRVLGMVAVCVPSVLSMSVGVAYCHGILYASWAGILIKGRTNAETLAKVKTMAFDKKGTLTKSELHVTRIDSEGIYDKTDILKYINMAEKKSDHRIARAVINEAKKFNIDDEEGENYVETVGHGVECDSVYGHIKVGGKNFVGVSTDTPNNVFISLNGKYIGSVGIGDELKSNSKIAFEQLRKLGIEKKIVLSCDKRSKVEAVARTLLADIAYSELKQGDNLSALNDIIKDKKGCVAYCGDGMYDSDALERADVGILVGTLDNDEAYAKSDIVTVGDDIEKIPLALKIAKRIRMVIVENIVLSIVVKTAVAFLCAFGIVPLFWAAVSDALLSCLCIANSLRAGK